MSNREFENYMALMSRLLRLSRAEEKRIRDELRDHLEFRVADLVESGTDPNEAVRKALEEFGDAASLAQQFQSIFRSNQKRWVMRFATFSVAGSFVALLLMMAMWPSPARFGAPNEAVAVQEQPTEGESFGVTGSAVASIESVSNNNPFNSPAKTRRTPVPTSNDIEQLLQKPMSIDYDEVPFADVMEELQEQLKINIQLDESATVDSLTEDDCITFSIKNARLSTTLRMMLKQHNATYLIDDGVLVIISLDDSDDPEFFRSKIFKVTDLLLHIEKSDARVGQPVADIGFGGGIDGERKNVGGGDGTDGNRKAGGGGMFCVPNQGFEGGGQAQKPAAVAAAEVRTQTKITAAFLLSNLVKTTVAWDSWNETNGYGSISMISGLMVVNQNEAVLEEIDNVLTELRRNIE